MWFKWKYIIVIWILVVGLFRWWVFAQTEINGEIKVNNVGWSCAKMVEWLDLTAKTKDIRAMTRGFCSIISKNRCTDDGDLFDSNQSVFLTLLCDNVWAGKYFDGIDREENGILLKTWFEQFGIYDYGFLDNNGWTTINFCDYTQNYMNGCDFSQQLPKMFDEIINDYFNIKQADLYWVDILSDGITSEDRANNFSRANFVWLELCDPESEYYGDTCKYLTNYMKDVKKLLTKTKVVDVKRLSKNKSKDMCTKDWENNILYCGLLWDDIISKKSFLNVIYNEYLRYRLFISYYSYGLSVEHNYSELTDGNTLDQLDRNREKIYGFQEQIFRTRQAVTTAFRSLSEISSSFAVHVGFLMYHEDAKMFMKKLSKLYPPIMTLYDKLRNVQKSE